MHDSKFRKIISLCEAVSTLIGGEHAPHAVRVLLAEVIDEARDGAADAQIKALVRSIDAGADEAQPAAKPNAQIEAAIIQTLQKAKASEMPRRHIVAALTERFGRSPIYRTLHRMNQHGRVLESGDVIVLCGHD